MGRPQVPTFGVDVVVDVDLVGDGDDLTGRAS
jgi:hypothetical protein